MQLKLPFRLTRGATVVLVIVFAHLIIAALFIRMRVKAPEMGPVFATIFAESPDADRESAKTQSRGSPASEPRLAPVEIKAAPDNVREAPGQGVAEPAIAPVTQ
ncbi:MAG: hypothetical protein WDO68_18195 [Gammaproteobacteria bacterium]